MLFRDTMTLASMKRDWVLELAISKVENENSKFYPSAANAHTSKQQNDDAILIIDSFAYLENSMPQWHDDM